MSALFLILLSAFTHAVVNHLTKQADDKFAVRLLIGTSSAVLIVPTVILLPPPNGLAVQLVCATALVHGVYEFLLVSSDENAAFSVAHPVARGSGPLFAAIRVFFVLRQPLGGYEILGIACVCAGVAGLGWSHRRSRGASSGIIYALATGGSIGVYTLIDATGVRAVHNSFVYVCWLFIVYGAAILVVAPAARAPAVLLSALRQVRMAPLFGVLAIAGYGGHYSPAAWGPPPDRQPCATPAFCSGRRLP